MRPRNQKAILLSGFARGGTNIAWNILQSHPEICSPIKETGELFAHSRLLRTAHRIGGRLGSAFLIRRVLYGQKMLTLSHPENRFISNEIAYTRQAVNDSILCLKSVNHDVRYTETLLKAYPELYFIALVRDGYALCDGYIRRGGTAQEAGQLYAEMAGAFQRCATMVKHFEMIKFEDIVQRPFEVARVLFEFAGMNQIEVDWLRLKSKRLINRSGSHQVVFGAENRKYWFDRNTVTNILVPDINQYQSERLTPQMVRDFNRLGHWALAYFGYPVRDT